MYQLTLCTCPDFETAKQIAWILVEEKLAACVNIINNVTSVYRWQGKIEYGQEVQLLIKSESLLFNKIATRVNELHPYDIPEIIALNIQQGDEHYLNWITESLK